MLEASLIQSSLGATEGGGLARSTAACLGLKSALAAGVTSDGLEATGLAWCCIRCCAAPAAAATAAALAASAGALLAMAAEMHTAAVKGHEGKGGGREGGQSSG